LGIIHVDADFNRSPSATVSRVEIAASCDTEKGAGGVSPVVVLRVGAIDEFFALVESTAANRLFLVVDSGALAACRLADRLDDMLRSREVFRFTDFDLNPKIEDVERGVLRCREFEPDLVVAFGGGTAIDLGKLVSSFAVQTAPPRDIVLGHAPIDYPGRQLVAIPTTAGTGSEATHFAVVYVDGEKYSVAHPSMLPAYAVIDPALTYSLPPQVTAATGLDAFCQAVESLWAVGSTDSSVNDATRAVRLAWQHLPAAVQHPTAAARIAMCEAAHYAGRAINVGKTTAPHALSYRITSRYGIPHGVAVAMTLSPLLAYNAETTIADCQDPRGLQHVQRQVASIVGLLGARDVAEACQKIEAFNTQTGSPSSLAAAGITEESQVRDIVSSVNAERMANNPRRLDPDVLQKLLMARA